jgi:hypothetical protein
MGVGTHKGHSGDTRRRIEEAREHYETRKERRVKKKQIWTVKKEAEAITS